MTHHEQERSYNEEILDQSQRVLQEAVAIVSPDSNASPQDVFPAPLKVRSEELGLDLTPDQETALRDKAAELGFGRETDKTLSNIGLFGAAVIIEGGLSHKIKAEAELVANDVLAQPKAIIFSANPKQGSENDEYSTARTIAESLKDFVSLTDDEVLPFGYSIEDEDTHQVTGTPTGQFVKIGTLHKVDVVMMRIDQADGTSADGQPRPGSRLRTADALKIISGIYESIGDKTTPVAIVSSCTYEATRNVDAVTASIETGRIMGCATYGTASLAKAKGEATPAPGPINQLPGELHKLSKQVAKLEAVLHPDER